MNKEEMLLCFTKNKEIDYNKLDKEAQKYVREMISRGKANENGGFITPSPSFLEKFNCLNKYRR